MQEAANIKLWNETVWNNKVADNERWYAAVAENGRKKEEERQARIAAANKAKNRGSRSVGVKPSGSARDAISGCEGGAAFLHRDHGPTSTASGKYGFLDGTWDGLDGVKGNGFMGYKRAMDAPEDVQDLGFDILWDGGNGRYHWKASNRCHGLAP